jgi:hypothetical protein
MTRLCHVILLLLQSLMMQQRQRQACTGHTIQYNAGISSLFVGCRALACATSGVLLKGCVCKSRVCGHSPQPGLMLVELLPKRTPPPGRSYARTLSSSRAWRLFGSAANTSLKSPRAPRRSPLCTRAVPRRSSALARSAAPRPAHESTYVQSASAASKLRCHGSVVQQQLKTYLLQPV